MTKFKIGDVVRVKTDDADSLHLVVRSEEFRRTGRLPIALCVSECGKRIKWSAYEEMELVDRPDPQADIKQVIMDVLLSDEFMAAFAAAIWAANDAVNETPVIKDCLITESNHLKILDGSSEPLLLGDAVELQSNNVWRGTKGILTNWCPIKKAFWFESLGPSRKAISGWMKEQWDDEETGICRLVKIDHPNDSPKPDGSSEPIREAFEAEMPSGSIDHRQRMTNHMSNLTLLCKEAKTDAVSLAMKIACERFGGSDGVFNGAGFSGAIKTLSGLNFDLDGFIVATILCGRTDVEVLKGGSHYRHLQTKSTEIKPNYPEFPDSSIDDHSADASKMVMDGQIKTQQTPEVPETDFGNTKRYREPTKDDLKNGPIACEYRDCDDEQWRSGFLAHILTGAIPFLCVNEQQELSGQWGQCRIEVTE